MFNKDWNTYKTNWQKGVSQNGFSGGVKSIFQSSNSNSVISKDQVQILRNWNNAVKHGCTDQTTFNRIIANADENTKMYFIGLNKGKASMEGLKNAQNVAKTSTIGLTIAQTALNMAISMGLMAAISLAIKGFDKFVNSAKRASEAADEAFSETNDKVQEHDRELKSLDELIIKYKELKESGNLDLKGRKEIKEIQNDIADLVGTQAKNLDLVNGKLDDEIKKLDEISAKEAKRAYETATANYNNSQKANKNATGDDSFLFFDGIAYTGKLDKETKKHEKEAVKILQKSGFYNVQLGGFLENTLFVRDEFDNNNKELKGAQEKADYLQSMIDVLEQNGQRATDLYAGLIKQRDDYLKYIDNQQSAADSLVNSWLTYSQFSNQELSKINVDSVESFKIYRKTMIDEAKKDESIGKMLADGTLSNEDLENAINDFMATSINFSTWYEQWINNVQSSTSDNKIDDSTILGNIQSLSKGLDQLDKIYADVKDGEYFDFSSILNNKEFTEAFGGLGESYENFIKTITNSPSDINACQQAFNDLATAYINNSGALANVTEETKNSTIAMLKQMGIANAEEVVTIALTKAKAKQSAEEAFLAEKKENSAISSSNLTDATWQEVYAVWAESNASDTAKQYLAQLALTKLDVQGIKIDSKSDVDNIIALANAAGTSTEYLNALKKALSTMQNFKGKVNYGYALVADKNERAKHEAYVDAENTVKDILNSVKNTQLKASDFYAPITYGGGSTSNKGNGGKDTKEQFDWIETKVKRLQRSITNFGKTVSATWKSWTERNSALKSQISDVTSEINLQQQAANKYLSLANSVGLGEGYKSLVRNGTLDISTITNENTINAIKQYQEYYEAYLSCLDAKQDAQDELANLVREDFDMIAKQFDSEISLVEANISTLEAYIDQTEMKGNLVSKNYYSAMYTEEQKNLSSLQKKYDQLSNKLSNGTIAQGSEEFNEMAKEIKEVSKAIVESNTALEEYQKTMRELDWEVFDLIEEKIGNVVEESEFLIDLLSNSKLFNDDGSITSQGQTTLGLHVANMKIYESQVKDYAEEIARLDKEFANDSLDQNYLERRQELVELQRDMILATQEERNSLKDLMSEGYDSLLSYMDELISKRKELLSQASDARSFQKTVQEQTDEISRLQNILNSYNGDLSEEAKSSIQKYEVELKEAESNLEDTLYDKYISDTEKLLDTLSDDAEEWISTRLEDTDALIDDVVKATDSNTNTIKTTLETEIKNVGGSLTTEMQNLWNGADGVKGVVGGVNNTLLEIKNLVQSMVKSSDTEASKNASNATTNPKPTTKPTTTPSNTSTSANKTPTATKTITVGGKINAGNARIYSTANGTGGGRQYYSSDPIYTVLGEQNGYLKVRYHKLSSGTTGWFKKSDVKAYKTGGLVDYTGLAWVDGQKGKPEAFLNANDTELFAKLKDSLEVVSKTNMFDAIQSYAKMPNFASNTNSSKNVEIHFENMTFPNVKNADDFITDLQHSKRFENIILEITDGKGDLSKYKW